MKYLLELNKLDNGDIVLESGDTKVVSALIQHVTESVYTHAMIYLEGTLIHAVSEGVFSKNPQRLIVSSPSKLKVLRLMDSISKDANQRICNNARMKIGSLYSQLEVLEVLSKKKEKVAKSKKQFCSRLVAQCYQTEGIKLVENADYCSPGELDRSEKLVEVQGSLRVASTVDILFSNTIDPNRENQNETFKWLKKVRKLYKKQNIDIQTINDVYKELSFDREPDKRICKFIKATRYLDLYNVDRKINKYRYNLKLFKTKLQYKDAQLFVNFEMKLNRDEFNRYSENFKIERANYRQLTLKFTKIHLKLYRNLLIEVRSLLIVIDRGVSQLKKFTVCYDIKYLIEELDILIYNKKIYLNK